MEFIEHRWDHLPDFQQDISSCFRHLGSFFWHLGRTIGILFVVLKKDWTLSWKYGMMSLEARRVAVPTPSRDISNLFQKSKVLYVKLQVNMSPIP